jgi:hypothetical protein
MSITRPKRVILTLAGLLSCVAVTLTLSAAPAAAVEQCRFITAKAEREACYQRQERELAAKRNKPEPKRDSTIESLQRMNQEDAELNRQIHGICRGC